uniref:Uncharacterized protein n=2 Tax=Canis lupus familiaris TaxID=9615 RepID=A0A8C0P900_CANLF
REFCFTYITLTWDPWSVNERLVCAPHLENPGMTILIQEATITMKTISLGRHMESLQTNAVPSDAENGQDSIISEHSLKFLVGYP